MKIIIVGAGRIGRNLARTLSEENHEVYLIEENEERVKIYQEKLDVQVLLGNGADPEVLKSVGVDTADLVISVTVSDETNLVVCSLASSYGAKRRIARVRNASLSHLIDTHQGHDFHIDETINPELLAAENIIKTVDTPGSNEVADFGGGQILLRAFDITEKSSLTALTLQELREDDFPWPFLIVSIIRNHEMVVPKGDTKLEVGDHIYVMLPKASLVEFLTLVDPQIKMPQNVLIYGAGSIGEHVAKGLSDHIKNIVILEPNADKAQEIAGRLEHIRVLCGSAADTDLLREGGVESADAFVASSNNDDTNLVSAVLAKEMGAKTTLIAAQHPDYVSIIDAVDIDVIINPQLLAVEQILHSVRGRGVSVVTKLQECNLEAIELIPEKYCKVTQQPIREIKFPENVIIGAVIRKTGVELAKGDTQIQPGDRVVVFCQSSSCQKLQKLFSS